MDWSSRCSLLALTRRTPDGRCPVRRAHQSKAHTSGVESDARAKLFARSTPNDSAILAARGSLRRRPRCSLSPWTGAFRTRERYLAVTRATSSRYLAVKGTPARRLFFDERAFDRVVRG